MWVARRRSVAILMVIMLPAFASGLGLFFRTPWVHEVGDTVLQQWFDLIARGRQEGPSSPYYVEFLALQSIACNQLDPIGPPCNASAPTHSKQARGNTTMPYGTIFYEDLAKLAKYFHLFDKVYIGTLWSDGFNPEDPASNTRAAEQQGQVAQDFYDTYGQHFNNLAWYITIEGSLNTIATQPMNYLDFATKTQNALLAVHNWEILWSPAWTQRYSSYNATGLTALKSGLKSLFCNLSVPLKLHYQDFLGQSVQFEFPFYYNYTSAFTCEEDSIPYYRLMQGIVQECPKLTEVKINAEMFAERLNNGQHGENNGANIISASPSEISQRLACYAQHNAVVGACWALPHWYYLWTYANATVYSPY